MKKRKQTEEERKLKAKEQRLWKSYGLSLEEHSELVKDGCFICKRKDGRLCVDHIHIKGYKAMPPEEKRKYVRACLCFMCNTAIRCVEKTADGKRNRQMLEGIIEYFKKYPIKGE